MIRAIVSVLIHRSIDQARPVPRPLRAAIRASSALTQLEADLRTMDGRLRSSTAGLVAEPPPWLVAATAARLGQIDRDSPPESRIRRRLTLAAALVGGVGAVGGMVAAALTAAALLRAAPAPVPLNPDAGSSSTLVAAMLQTPERMASADALTDPLRAEAQRLRDDTHAAASFLLDRLRIIGVQAQQ